VKHESSFPPHWTDESLLLIRGRGLRLRD